MQKTKPARSKKYMAWIREQGCCVSNSPFDTVAHHVRLGAGAGMGQKPSDFRTLPLQAATHVKLHHVGEARFWDEVEIDPEIEICLNLLKYICENGDELRAISALENIAKEI